MRQPINEEEKRRRRIIDFISAHQGCIAEDIVEGVRDYIGRGKVFKILPDLKHERIVREEKPKQNSREIKLFVDEDNPLVSVPKDLYEFHQIFMTFLQRITEETTPFISSFASELSLYFEDFKKKRGKKRQEKLKNDEIKLVFDIIESDIDGSTDLGELSFHLSKFVKAIGILGKFIQICMALSILVWRPGIKDKDSFNKLLSIVYNEISNMQIETIHVINNAFHHVEHNIPVIIKGKELTEALNEQYDLEEIFEYYKSVWPSLENEVKPLIEFLKRMNKDIIEPQDNLPLDRLPFFIGQSDWTANRVKEYLNPEEYYADTSHQKILQEMEDLEESFRE